VQNPPRLTFAVLLVATLLVLGAPVAEGQNTPPPAHQILSQAEAEAAAQHKDIFLIFGASWCGWCKKLDQFDHSPEVGAILNRSFVLCHLTVEERGSKAKLDNPGAQQLMEMLGGRGGLPFFAFLDARGQAIVTSNRPSNGEPGDTNIGFPGRPEEIDWFVTMVRRAVPLLTVDEGHAIERQLRRIQN
jgi:thioredoxin-related protein